MRHRRFQVLFVCTANHCRSPLAEHLLRRALAVRDLPWLVGSAGTKAMAGIPAHPHVATVLSERGMDITGWTSTQINAQLIGLADLVLPAEAANRSSIVQLDPRAVHSTFLMRQFAALAEALPPGSIPVRAAPGPSLVTDCRKARGQLQPGSAHQYEIPDPIGLHLNAFRECADLIQRSIDTILAPIR